MARGTEQSEEEMAGKECECGDIFEDHDEDTGMCMVANCECEHFKEADEA
jgi:hypothetical protein